MRATIGRTAIAVLALAGLFAPAGAAAAPEPKPAWQLFLLPLPTNFEPGAEGTTAIGPMFRLIATNVGGASTKGMITVKVALPAGLTPFEPVGDTLPNEPGPINPECEAVGQIVTCTVSEPTPRDRWIGARIPVEVASEPTLKPGDLLTATATVEGGEAEPIQTSYETEIGTKAPPFDLLPGAAGLSTLFTNPDGTPTTQAGSHPDQATISIGLPIAQPVKEASVTAAGHIRSLTTELPRGLVGNPTATKRCTEAQLISGSLSNPGCPDDSQVGLITAMTVETVPIFLPVPLYNMVPPPGAPAELGFNALNVNIFIHLDAELRSESDYGVSVHTDDILARTFNPIMSAQAQIWGDPTAQGHDELRGLCRFSRSDFCPVERRNQAFLAMPSACSGPLSTTVGASSWEEPGVVRERSAQSTDIFEAPVGVSGCSALEFKPSLTVQPDSEEADSPTGAYIALHLPQDEEVRDGEGEPALATADLKDTTLTLPEGMALNPAAAGGLQACTNEQIGLRTPVGQTPIHFSSERPRCPLASKVGTVKVKTPLLDHSLPGAVYVAAPYDNPFGTLLGVYVVIDDPADGIVVKLAGKTEADPVTGQLKTTFEEAPELPFEDFEVDLKSGPRAILRTPPACGTYTTRSLHTPWSSVDAVLYEDPFTIDRGAGGAPCASSEAQLPNEPGFEAGTETPLAASYSPFLGRLSRADGTQLLRSLSISPPPGLSGRLAGVDTCTDAALAAASAKSGREELASPSCPAGSQIGEVEVGAGAGSAPYYTTGKVYLAAPYKGAPLSGAVVTPAVAGPFDLGTVVVRVPAYVDSVSARLRFATDEFPHILQGIPLDLRDARVFLDRERFTLNPSSCAPNAVSGEAISLLGQSAPLSVRFQVGGCRGLDYAPRLFLRLRGGTKRGAHPKLRAVLTAKPGEEANTARASVALPRSEFLENAHIRTVCTRVQFAAKECPKGSIYGYARAFTPILDQPFEGPVYLRSSSHELPDMVAALHGPADKPIEVELAGRIDSVKGAIRNTFDLVPDQPVSKFILWLKGARKGLLVNSRDICARTYRATVKLDGQNGKTHDFHPPLKASCHRRRKKHAKHRRR